MYDLKQYKKVLKNWRSFPKKMPNYLLSKIFKNSSTVRTKPIFAQIEPTNRCNLKCEMCALRAIKNDKRIGDMKIENYKKIVDNFPELFGIMLQGLGEPLLNNDFLKMVEYTKKNGIFCITTTNGTLLNPKICEGIISSGIDTITISVDGAKKETYESIRKGANFDLVLNNIKTLVETKKRLRGDTSIYIAWVLMKKNIAEVPLMVDLASELGIDSLNLQEIAVTNEYPLEFTKPQKIKKIDKEISYYLRIAKEKAKENGLKMTFPDQRRVDRCMWLWERIYITWDGYVTPCCGIVNEFMGNVFKQDFWKIWNGKYYREMRRTFLQNKVPSICKGCSLIKVR